MSNGRRPKIKEPMDDFIGSSPAMQHVLKLARCAAECSSNVLLQGEIGTGKQWLAKSIHRMGGQELNSFYRINCGAFDENQLEIKLFGTSSQPGLMSSPNGGTLMLQDANLLPNRLQAKLLEFLEEQVEGVSGSAAEVDDRVSVRLIASSSFDMAKEVAEERFREDLFWRLNVLPITLPPLRRRKEDLEELIRCFLRIQNTESRIVDKIHPDALAALKSYQWPGNLRELQTYMERAQALADSQELTPELLPTSVLGDRQALDEAVFRPTDEKSLVYEFVYNRLRKAPGDSADLHKQIVEPIEKELLVQILDLCNHVQKKAADRLGINRNTLYKKLKEYGLEKPNAKATSIEADDPS